MDSDAKELGHVRVARSKDRFGLPGLECDHAFLRWQQCSQSKLRMIRVLIRVRDTSTPTWCDRPVEGPACRPTLIPCRSTINSRSLRRGLDDCHVVAFHVAALSKALPKSAQRSVPRVISGRGSRSAGCCARAMTGHASAPPKSVMNSRRLIGLPQPAQVHKKYSRWDGASQQK